LFVCFHPRCKKNQKVFCKSFFYEMILSLGHACFAYLLPCKLPKKKKKPKSFSASDLQSGVNLDGACFTYMQATEI
jgi:hypothetical protein